MQTPPSTNKTRIRLVDVTLDSLCRAVCVSFDDKLARAEALAVSGIDILDVGDVLQVPGKRTLVREIAQSVRGISLAACAQGNLEAIQAAWDAIQDAEQPVLRVCMQISDWHRIEDLHQSEQELLQDVRTALALARQRCPTVEFVAEDATRCDDASLCRFIAGAIEQGASIVTLADTVGYDLPLHYAMRFRMVMAQVAAIHPITLGVAAHNRDGYAASNTLAAICAGARQVTVDEMTCGHLKRAELEAALRRLAASHRSEGKLPPPPFY